MLSEKVSPFSLPLLEWCLIPSGTIVLEGTGEVFEVPSFQMGRYPITNAQYDAFIQAGGYKQKAWWNGLEEHVTSPRASDWREENCPKLQVSWFEAVAYCRWLSDRLAQPVRLPTEWEWQWAAAGSTGWAYAYGDTFDLNRCSTRETGIERTHPVNAFAEVSTPFGVVDMSGHVWEWCLNRGTAPYQTFTYGMENRAVRGGSWHNAAQNACVTYRASRTPRTRTFNIGFRVMIGEPL
ncbi:MAG: SUMF1/EgtB/PvdO family nonheme iron enzyme [Anaerolineae bacterium]